MDVSLPQTPELKDIQKSNKEYGRWNTIKDQFQSTLPLSIFIVLIGIFGSGYFVYKDFNDRISTIENIYNTNTNNNNLTVNNNVASIEAVKTGKDSSDGLILGLEKVMGFSQDDWIVSGFNIDEQGYFCPKKKGFDYWSIWTRKSYSPLVKKILIKFAIKQSKNNDNPPTMAITYGEYLANKSPIQFYRLNIFDTDTKTLRLYNNKNNSKAQGWLEEEPDLDSEMTIELFPTTSDRESRVISINPSLVYVNLDNSTPITFKPNSKFDVELPTVGIEDGTVQKQIGIGTPNGVCFKVFAFEVLE